MNAARSSPPRKLETDLGALSVITLNDLGVCRRKAKNAGLIGTAFRIVDSVPRK
jgi:hypothetical protein